MRIVRPGGLPVPVPRGTQAPTTLLAVGALHAPTQEKIATVLESARKAFADASGIVPAGFGVLYSIENCSAEADRLTKAARDDAQRQPTAIADAMALHLGSVTAVLVLPSGGSGPSSFLCGPAFFAQPVNSLYAMTSVAPEPKVSAFANLTVTYGIKATP